MKVSEIIELMAGMQTYRIGQLTVSGPEGVQLTVMPDARPVALSASGGISSKPEPTAEQAVRAVQAARLEATRLAQAKVEEQKAKVNSARRRVSGGIGTQSVARLAEDVFKEVMSGPKPAVQSASIPDVE